MTKHEVEIRSGEIDEILGKPPTRIIRWGISAILIIFLILVIFCWIFKYPDFINSNIEIMTLNPPAEVISKVTEKIDSLYIKNNEVVKKGQILVTIKNPAQYNDVLRVYCLLDTLKNFINNIDSAKDIHSIIATNFKLGELQSFYSTAIFAYNDLVSFYKLNFYNKKIQGVKNQINDYKLYYCINIEQQETLKSVLDLSEKSFKRNEKLFFNQTIAEADLDESRIQYLSRKASYESINALLANIHIQITELENDIIDFELQNEKQKEDLESNLNEVFENLYAQLEIWEQLYVLKAPLDGFCVFTKYWNKNQVVVADESVMTIVPNVDDQIIGKLYLPVIGAGKVQIGQKVIVKLYNYPYLEFGILEGVVQNISSIPKENYYFVEVYFPKGVTTSYNINLPFSQNMQGSAEIVTKDERLLYKIIRPIKYIIKEKI